VQEGAVALLDMLQQKLQRAPIDQAILLTRMCGHYLNLTAIAEQHFLYEPSPTLCACHMSAFRANQHCTMGRRLCGSQVHAHAHRYPFDLL
jgi:hypothetical protein